MPPRVSISSVQFCSVQCCFPSTETVGRGAQDGHLHFHTAPEPCVSVKFKFSVALRPQRPSIKTFRDGHLDFHTAPELCVSVKVQVQRCFTSTETVRTVRDGEPRTATSTFTQLLSSVFQFVKVLIFSDMAFFFFFFFLDGVVHFFSNRNLYSTPFPAFFSVSGPEVTFLSKFNFVFSCEGSQQAKGGNTQKDFSSTHFFRPLACFPSDRLSSRTIHRTRPR